MIDLDGFKPINDSLGHDAGDSILTLAARVMKGNCRETDIIARLGGDEFVILMPDTDQKPAHHVGDRIINRFAQESEVMLQGIGSFARVSMSDGLSLRLKHRPDTGEKLIRLADEALDRAKDSGKVCLRIYDGTKAA